MSYNTRTYTARELRRMQAKDQRRARAPRRVPKGTGLEGIALLNSCLPYDEGDTTIDHIKTREAFARLAGGAADKDDFDRVVVALNLARIRAEQIDPGLSEEIGTAQAALGRCKDRYLRTGTFGFDGPGLQAMHAGLDCRPCTRAWTAGHARGPGLPRSHHQRQRPAPDGTGPPRNVPPARPPAHRKAQSQ